MKQVKEKMVWQDLKGLGATLLGGTLLACCLLSILGVSHDIKLMGVFSKKKYNPFHEISWNGRKVAIAAMDTILKDRELERFIQRKVAEDSTHRVFASPVDEKKVPTAPGKKKEEFKKVDTFFAQNRLKYTNDYYKIIQDLRDSARTSSDTDWQVWYGKIVLLLDSSPSLDSVMQKDSQDTLKDTLRNFLPVKVVFKTNRIPGFSDTLSYAIPVKKEIPSDDFLVKYTSLGLWILLVIVQLVTYPLLILWILIMLFEHNIVYAFSWIRGRQLPVREKYDAPSNITLLHVLSTSFVCFIFYLSLLYPDDNSMVKPEYFMLNLDDILRLLNGMGYLCAGFWLASMLLIYSSIRKIKADTCKKRYAIQEEIAQKEKTEKYNDLVKRFNLYFAILSLILTLGTLSTSTLFTGLNSLPLVKAIALSQGYTPFPGDYVLMYGLLHSAILLAYYILLRSQLNEVKKSLDIKEADDINKLTFSKRVIDILITGSPLLGPLLQTIFENL